MWHGLVEDEDIWTFHRNFSPVFVERAFVQIGLNDWENARDSYNRALKISPKQIDALLLQTIDQITHERPSKDTVSMMKRYRDILVNTEPNNAQLLHQASSSLCRLSGKHKPYVYSLH